MAKITSLLKRQENECLGNLLCECRRRKCPAYTVSITTFWRGVKSLPELELE